jgi:hypothetical protein
MWADSQGQPAWRGPLYRDDQRLGIGRDRPDQAILMIEDCLTGKPGLNLAGRAVGARANHQSA